MSQFVNFKKSVVTGSSFHHFYCLEVVCVNCFNRISFDVMAISYDGIIINLAVGFSDPQAAFDFLNSVCEKYPGFGDDRDYDENNSPVYSEDLYIAH